ncbi:pentapeptide repeat-containing protein [Calothrix sp. 336/3]
MTKHPIAHLKANLSDVDFTGAHLSNADLSVLVI